MTLLRSCLKFLGSFALVVSFAGCDSGGPEAFAPGSKPDAAPASTVTHQPLGPAAPGPASQNRFKKGSLPTEGPKAHP
jgi:predicted small lipoprotein YifL